MFWFLFILTLSTFDKDLEEPEPTLEEYDGFLSVPYGASEKSVGTPTPASCDANGIFCKCGFQDVAWKYQQLAGNKDCYTLKGVCQHCGLKDRVVQLGFDYKFLPPQHEDVYELRTLSEGEIWNPPQYNYQCKEGSVITAVRSKYTRLDSLGGRDFYTLKIKCGKLKGEDDPNLKPANWNFGDFPWLKAGEHPECEDLEETRCKASTECEWKPHARKCEMGNPFMLESLISNAKNNPGVEKTLQDILKVNSMENKADSTKPKPWSGEVSRRNLEEDALADNELEDFDRFLTNVMNEFSEAVPEDEKEIGEQQALALDPFLAEILEEFGQSLMEQGRSDSVETEVGVSRDSEDDSEDFREALKAVDDNLEYYDFDQFLDDRESAINSAQEDSSEDLTPMAVGDDFFDLDDEHIIQNFLHNEQLHENELAEGETEVGSSLPNFWSGFGAFKTHVNVHGLAKESGRRLGLGIVTSVVSNGFVVARSVHFGRVWLRTRDWIAASLLHIIIAGVLLFSLLTSVAYYLRWRRTSKNVEVWMGTDNEDVLEF